MKTLAELAEYRIITEFLYDWEYWQGPHGRFVYVSPACLRISGYDRLEFLDDPGLYERIIHPEDYERVKSRCPSQDEESSPVDFRIVRADGGVRWVRHVCRGVFDERGKPLGRRGCNQDITDFKAKERKGDDLDPLPEPPILAESLVALGEEVRKRDKAEEERRHSEEILRALIDGIQEYAIYMIDPQGLVVTWNLGAQRIKGYKAHEILGKHFSCFFPEEDIISGKPQRELQIALEQGRCEETGWRVRKDGSKFRANVVLTPLRDREGRLRGFAKITRDLTK
jgi:PAS domain S-box-containing protein